MGLTLDVIFCQLVEMFYFPDSSIDSKIFDDSQTILITHSYQAHNDTSGNCFLSLDVFIVPRFPPFSKVKVIEWLAYFCGVISINTTYPLSKYTPANRSVGYGRYSNSTELQQFIDF